MNERISDMPAAGALSGGELLEVVQSGVNKKMTPGTQLKNYITGSILKVSFVATEDISAGDMVTSDGKKADSNQVNHRNRIIGIAGNNVSNGSSGFVTGYGEMKNSGWSWVKGDKIFLNGTSLSTTPPSVGFVQMIGTATAADTIDVNIQQGILL